MNPNLARLSEKARNLTHDPGVYLMKDKKGEIIYIGKAKNLKNRVSQYFQPNNPSHTEKVRRMVENVEDFDYIVVGSEFEALVLECSLIKQNAPKYNILLKDDKGYHYIRVEKGPYPRITAQKQLLKDDGADYLGPYTSSYSVTQTVDEVNKIFGLPTCNKKFPQEFRKTRPCLNYHIKQCMGVCRGRISEAEYRAVFDEALAYIKKGGGSLLSRLEKQMEEAAEALDFERAARLRDRIRAIRHIADTQKVFLINSREQDVIAFAQNMNHAAVAVLKFRNYRLSDKDDYVFPDVYDLPTVRQEFLNQYYLQNGDIPPRILIDEAFDGDTLLSEYLSEKLGRKVSILVPQKGDSKKMVEMAFQNATEKLSKQVMRTGREVAALDELAKLLGLKKPPAYIEAYDISNLGESAKVGGMVVFENGRPLKKAYKKFKIREVEGQDDYSSMREVLTRRLTHYMEEKDSGEGFGRLPDLILLDGGKGHVAAILPVIAQFHLDIPVFGMVKDSRHRTRAIAKDGGEIAISGNRTAFSFVTTVQDEVHRYSINYQKTVHKQSALEITITRVPGIGKKKAEMLLKTYKTRAELLAAAPEELQKTAKVKAETAQELYDFLHALE
ncbi:MAG: excinuclease ABC subunit UvrC [Oscillospiraceae bacterium]|nr:excinuclease ABC subunit UvrC [Oscillospiraceae bacterium]MDY3065330.1 excinuclease ABC subunit UvrC [Oscillospiraceae bacterium]